MKIYSKPYNLFLLTTTLYLASSLFSIPANKTFDIHLHDTYFIIDMPYILVTMSILYFIIWLIYILTRKLLLSRLLTWIHIVTTILSPFFLGVLFVVTTTKTSQPHTNYYNWETTYSWEFYITATMLLLLTSGQIIFLINIVIGMFKYHRLK